MDIRTTVAPFRALASDATGARLLAAFATADRPGLMEGVSMDPGPRADLPAAFVRVADNAAAAAALDAAVSALDGTPVPKAKADEVLGRAAITAITHLLGIRPFAGMKAFGELVSRRQIAASHRISELARRLDNAKGRINFDDVQKLASWASEIAETEARAKVLAEGASAVVASFRTAIAEAIGDVAVIEAGVGSVRRRLGEGMDIDVPGLEARRKQVEGTARAIGDRAIGHSAHVEELERIDVLLAKASEAKERGSADPRLATLRADLRRIEDELADAKAAKDPAGVIAGIEARLADAKAKAEERRVGYADEVKSVASRVVREAMECSVGYTDPLARLRGIANRNPEAFPDGLAARLDAVPAKAVEMVGPGRWACLATGIEPVATGDMVPALQVAPAFRAIA